MYTEQDITAISAQIRKRWIGLGIPLACCLAGVIAALVLRQETMADVFTILMGVLLIGGYDLLIKPLVCYRRMLNGCLHGITHELTDCTFSHLDEDISLVEGVSYYGLTVVCLDEKNKPYDRLFYYDAEKPRPSFAEGTPLRLVYHDRSLCEIGPA